MQNHSSRGKPAANTVATSSSATDLKRRRFLFSLGGAGAASAAVSSLPAVAAVAAADEHKDGAQSGYRVTEHVRDYYRTAKV